MKQELRPFIFKSSVSGSIAGWVGVSEDLQGRANSVSQVDGVSDMAHAGWLCGSVGGGLRKGTMSSAPLSVWDKAVPQLPP